ncbi:hypothetical protein D3C81_1666780 [compost metagenome]
MPERRLNMLSVRSPTTEDMTNSAAPSKPSRIWPKPQSRLMPTTRVITRLTAMPPYTPSQLLPGLTCGASLRLPKARPEKYAPISAAHTSTITDRISQLPSGQCLSSTSPCQAGSSTSRPISSRQAALAHSSLLRG